MTIQPVKFSKPHHIPAARGPEPVDIAMRRRGVELCFDLFVSTLHGYLDDLRDPSDFSAETFALIADARAEIMGELKSRES